MCETPGSAAASPEAALTLYYQEETCFFQGGGLTFPSRSAMIRLIQELRLLLFPGYFASEPSDCSRESFAQHHVCLIRELLVPQLLAAFGTDADAQESSASALRAEQSAEECLMRLPSVRRLLQTDIRAAFDGDPASRSREEIILAFNHRCEKNATLVLDEFSYLVYEDPSLPSAAVITDTQTLPEQWERALPS